MGLTAAMLWVGCGGSDSPSEPTTGASATSENSGLENSNAESSNAEPSKEFLSSGENGQLAKIGSESGDAEREAASQVLEQFLQAGEAGDWKTQCSLLAASTREGVEDFAQPLGDVDCPTALGSQAERAPASVRANTMTGPIDAFRINQGINGFAFYHGTRGRDFVIPMIDQGGWKVVALTAEEIG